jgi:hypothetical protein
MFNFIKQIRNSAGNPPLLQPTILLTALFLRVNKYLAML